MAVDEVVACFETDIRVHVLAEGRHLSLPSVVGDRCLR